MDAYSDLLYMNEREYYERIQSEIVATFPNAKFEDGSDYIHAYRFSVEIEGISQDDWILWLMRNGWYPCSFNYEYLKLDKPTYLHPLIQQVIAEQQEATK